MIEINLISGDLRPKVKKEFKGIESKNALYFIIAAGGILILIHIYLAGVFIVANSQLSGFSRKWAELAPQKKTLDDFQKEYSLVSEDAQAIQQLIGQRLNCAEKLNRLSLSLPPGVWFTELSIVNKKFELKGTVVSLEKQEVGLINKFLNSLKSDPSFFKGFEAMELDSVQARSIGAQEVVDFIFVGTLKQT